MGASNTSSNGGNTQFFKLKQEKVNEKMTGKICFARQEKVDGQWQSTEEFINISGYFKSIAVTSYEWQQQTRRNLEIVLIDDEDGHTEINISLGFDTSVCRTILQSLSSQERLGLIRFECREPKSYNGKMYPSLFVINNGVTCQWKWTEKNGNKNEIPEVKVVKDEEGNTIKKGVKAATEFWTSVVEKLNTVPKAEVIMTSHPQPHSPQNAQPSPQPSGDLPWDDEQLPF